MSISSAFVTCGVMEVDGDVEKRDDNEEDIECDGEDSGNYDALA